MRTRLAALLSAGSLFLLAGCATPPEAVPARQRLLVWPQPPDLPRYLYETALRSGRDVVKESDEDRIRRLITGAEADAPGFKKPLGVAARGGRVYVTDTEGRRVHVFDAARRRFFTFGYRLEGELKKPAGIAVDHRGNVYVADVTARRVIRYDAFGLFSKVFGGGAELERPTGVAVSPSGDRVYVVDTGGVDSDKHEVVAYDAEARKLFAIGPRGRAEGRFNLPVDAVVAGDCTLYVLDAGNFRVQAFDRDGRYLRSFGSVGSAPGQFSRPRGIAVDRDGAVYVSDAGFANVQVFDPQGRLLLAIGERGTVNSPGRYGLPAGVAADETGRVYIVDQYFHKVEVLRRLTEGEGQKLLGEPASR